MNNKKVKNIIERKFPKFKVKTAKFIGRGCDSEAYLINKVYIFRFPWHNGVSQKLEREIHFLPSIKKRIKLDIPNFEFIGKCNNNFFVGYEAIHGYFLTKQLFYRLPEKTKEMISKQLASFITNLQSFPLNKALKYKIKRENYREKYQKLFRQARLKLFPLLADKEKEKVKNIFNQYFSNKENFRYKEVVLHHDLSPAHILLDNQKKKVKGIIDWGDLSIGDPDQELIYPLDDYCENFVKRLLRYSKPKNKKKLMVKLKFLCVFDDIDCICYHIKDKNKVKKSLNKLRKRIKNWSLT